jgi:DNA repair exonuclease SbcCD ATPase subunit
MNALCAGSQRPSPTFFPSNTASIVSILQLILVEQENEEVKQMFADIPDEDRRQISKLSIKIAQITEEKAKLQVQVVGLTQ